MRYLIVLLGILMSVQANSVHWQSNYDEAHHQAVKSSKNIMVFLIEKDQAINKQILINTFMNQDYISTINKRYISIIITKNQKTSYPIESLFTVEYPAVFFLDERDLFLCSPIFGTITPDRLKAYLLECN